MRCWSPGGCYDGADGHATVGVSGRADARRAAPGGGVMPTKLLKLSKLPCRDDYHRPRPAGDWFQGPGWYQHTCPSCNEVTTFFSNGALVMRATKQLSVPGPVPAETK